MDLATIDIKVDENKKRSKIKPIWLGLVSDPPTLILTYEVMTTTSDNSQSSKPKRRKRKMPLRNFTDRSKINEYAFTLTQRHSEFLADVLPVTVHKMLRVIQEIMKGLEIEDALKKVNKEYEINGEEDLNKLTTDELDRKKSIMDEEFRKHLIRPGDPGYVYDRVVQFDQNEQEPSAWDEDTDNDDQDVKPKKEVQSEETVIKEINTDFVNVNRVEAAVLNQSENDLKENKIPEMPQEETNKDLWSEKPEKQEGSLKNEEEVKDKADGIKPANTEMETKKTSSDSEGLDQVEIETGIMDFDDDDFWT